MNEDKNYRDCTIPEDIATHETNDQYVDGEFVYGLIKWVKLPHRPPWPAVIDVCPDQNISHRLDCRNDVIKQLVHVHFFGHYDGMSTRGKSVLEFAVNTCIDWKNYDR